MSNDSINSNLISQSAGTRLGSQLTSFYQNAILTRNSEHNQHKSQTHFDFISTLALAQERNLDFLPFKWRPDMDDDPRNILRGGTSRINQLRVDIGMSMAFKVVKVLNEFNQLDYKKTYRALCHEIAILTSPQIREHPNIVQLEGLGWDIDEEKVMPVLVLEKASCGDASRFFASEESKFLNFDEKLKLCSDVANALMLLHSCHIVHGDIKPENILIDRDTAGSFVAKLADFGYSSLYSAGQLHALPKSRPWNAPEISSFEVNFEDAVSTDIYSYTMVCFWILFQEKTVVSPSGGDTAPWLLRDAQSNVAAIEELKYADELKRIACNMVIDEELLDPRQKHELSQLFEQTLVKVDAADSEHTTRQTNFAIILGLLGNDSVDIADPKDSGESAAIPESDFQICIGLLQISRLDYRIRQYLVSELQKDAEEQECADCRENAAYQLALCYKLGFGIKRDLLKSSYWLSKSRRDGTFAEVMQRLSIPPELSPEVSFDENDRQKPYIDVEIMFTKLTGTDAPYYSARMNSFYNDDVLTSIDYVGEYSVAGVLSLEEACDTYKREALDIQEELGYDHEVTFLLRNILSWLLKEAGQLEVAKEIGQEHYEFLQARSGFGPEHIETIRQLNFLAEIYQEEGNFELSKSHLQKVLEIQQRTMSPDHLGILLTLNNLAETSYDEGEYDLAEGYANKAFSGRLKALGEQNIDTLISMNNLGTTWIAQDKLEEAEKILSRAETVSMKILGATNYYTLTVVNNLGAALHFQDKFAEALSKLETSLENCRTTRGPFHPSTSTSMLNLANFFMSRGDYEAARELCQTSAKNLEEKLGPEHPSTLEARESMIRVAEGDNDYQLAETLARSLLEVSKQVLGDNHIKTLNRADTLASMLMNSRKYPEAGDLYQWALERKEMQLGKDDPQTLISVHNLANVFYSERRYEEARELFSRSYEGLRACRGPLHSSTLMSLGKLAAVYGGLKEYDAAERMARETIAGFKELDRKSYEEEGDSDTTSHGDLMDEGDNVAALEAENNANNGIIEESPSTLNAMCILGVILERGDREAEAEPLYRHMLRGFESQFGPDSHDALTTRICLVRVLYEQAKYTEAMEMAIRAESGLQDLLGPDHPDTVVAKSNLSKVTEKLKET